jgi:hypothetical protein
VARDCHNLGGNRSVVTDDGAGNFIFPPVCDGSQYVQQIRNPRSGDTLADPRLNVLKHFLNFYIHILPRYVKDAPQSFIMLSEFSPVFRSRSDMAHRYLF